MKCPHCGASARMPSCRSCGYVFCFDPKSRAMNPLKMTDSRFLSILKHATAGDTRFITADELFAAACRKAEKPVLSRYITAALLVLSGVALVMFAGLQFGWVFILVGLGRAFFGRLLPQIERSPWDDLVKRWGRERGLPKLIQQPSLHLPPPEWPEPDIYDYGFERLLICDQQLTVDWLVKNGLHTQERAVIMSEDGYPRYLLPRVQKALAERRDLPVFLLHSNTPHGMSLSARVQADSIFDLSGHPVTDLGIAPADVERLGLPRNLRRKFTRVTPHALGYAALSAMLPAAFLAGAPLAAVAAHSSVDAGSSSFG